MTSTEIVHEEIDRFLRDVEPSVLCLTGKWGVGKTFTWKQAIRSAKTKNAIGLKSYAYVSLFGQNSLDDVRAAIVEETRPISAIDAPFDLNDLKQTVKSAASNWRRVLNQARGAAAEYLPISESISGRWLFATVRNQIICIDDLERAGSGLTAKDVLGLISFLKEERKCKVVLLLNQEKLDEGKRDFEEQLEKVIDVRLEFDPTPQEAVDIGLKKGTAISEFLQANCVTLGITNIRVIQKIERLALELAERLNSFDSAVLKQAIHSVTLFGWMFFQPDQSPPLKFVTTYTPWKYVRQDKKEKEQTPPEEQAWHALLHQYGLTNIDEFDRVILDGVQAGAFDRVQLHQAATALSKQLESQRLDNSFSQAWALYRGSFSVTPDELLDKMAAAFRGAVKTITPTTLSSTVELFKALGRPEQALELLKYYVEHRRDGGANLFDLRKSVFGGDVKDPDIRNAFAQEVGNEAKPFDPGKTLHKIAVQSGWNDEDLVKLAELDAEAFRKLFKSIEGDELIAVVSAALQFGKFGNASEDMQKIAQSASDALRMIAQESKLRERQIATMYGITIEQIDPSSAPK
jgi:hypothetical protein